MYTCVQFDRFHCILVLDDQILSKKICLKRAILYSNNQDGHNSGDMWSVVADLLNMARYFNMIGKMCNMVIWGHSYIKIVWKKIYLFGYLCWTGGQGRLQT